MNKFTDFITNPEFIFGSSIVLINIYNIKCKANRGFWNDSRYVTASIFKGCIYGSFWPFSAMVIGINAFHGENEFKKHFIPFSRYGSVKDQEEI